MGAAAIGSGSGSRRRSRMRKTLIVIGLDSAPPDLLERWVEQGHLPHIASLQQQGATCPLRGPDWYLSEQVWTLILTGCEAEHTGYWSRWSFDPQTYELRDTGAYAFRERRPFYALGSDYRTAIFDVPQARIAEDVSGIQIQAWGARSARTGSASDPPGLLAQIHDTHGRHPAFDRDHASYWNPIALAWLEKALLAGIRRRAAICRDLLSREQWDLFFTVFGETHSAGHYFWHVSQAHPLRRRTRDASSDPLLGVFQAVDRAIGEILSSRPDADVLLFSPEGMSPNAVDLPSTVFLPELLFRLTFGRPGLASGDATTPPGPPIRFPKALGWYRELYALRADTHRMRRRLRRWLPLELSAWWEQWSPPGPGPADPRRFGSLFHQPSMWYSPHWPTMKSFALPSIAHGYIRINVQGRDAHGLVAPEHYGAYCQELSDQIHALRDARTGRPLVKEIVRTRTTPQDRPDLPDADLIVFYASEPTDVVDSPTVGRIGPVPYARTGGHVNQGVAIVKAAGCQPGSTLPPGHVRDIAPTILSWLGAPGVERLAGVSFKPGQLEDARPRARA
jgi:predicted AlkP superfamily phosphohydrolase/phosphomutase